MLESLRMSKTSQFMLDVLENLSAGLIICALSLKVIGLSSPN